MASMLYKQHCNNCIAELQQKQISKPTLHSEGSELCIMSTQNCDEEPQPRSRLHSPVVNDGNVDEHGIETF